MNRLTRLIACSVLVAAPVLVFAQDSSEQMPRGGMMNQEQMQEMQENMTQMQGMMQEMRDAKSDDERQRIREKHMGSMQNHMGMMRGGMMGQGMMGNGQEKRSGGPGMDDAQRMQMMEHRMDQMQLMMEQMLEHQRQQRP